MPIWQQITAPFRAQLDMLGFAADAMPSPDEWLVAFTRQFLRRPEVARGAQLLMSGLRFFTADFVAALTLLPPGERRHPALPGDIPQATYTAAGPIIVDVYERLIGRKAGPAEIERGFLAAAPALLGHYDGAVYVTTGAHLRFRGTDQ